MTDKQALFVEAYLGKAKLNATKAAKMAGYLDPDKEGWRVRQDPEVAAEISGRIEQYGMGAEEVVSRLAAQARGNIADFIEANHWGGKPVIVFDEKTLQEHGNIVKRFRSGKQGVEIELYDAQAALVHLGKLHGLFSEKSDVNVGGELRISVVYEEQGQDAGNGE